MTRAPRRRPSDLTSRSPSEHVTASRFGQVNPRDADTRRGRSVAHHAGESKSRDLSIEQFDVIESDVGIERRDPAHRRQVPRRSQR